MVVVMGNRSWSGEEIIYFPRPLRFLQDNLVDIKIGIVGGDAEVCTSILAPPEMRFDQRKAKRTTWTATGTGGTFQPLRANIINYQRLETEETEV